MTQVPATRPRPGVNLPARRERPVDRLLREFETMFDRLWSGALVPAEQDTGAPRLWDFDIKENDKEIVIRADLPGFEENEVDVRLDHDVLTIRAEKEQKGEGREEYRSFYRAVALPPGIDATRVQGSYRNGVLELHLPRSEGSAARRISLQGQQASGGSQGQQTQGNGGTQGPSAGNRTPAQPETAKK